MKARFSGLSESRELSWLQMSMENIHFDRNSIMACRSTKFVLNLEWANVETTIHKCLFAMIHLMKINLKKAIRNNNCRHLLIKAEWNFINKLAKDRKQGKHMRIWRLIPNSNYLPLYIFVLKSWAATD